MRLKVLKGVDRPTPFLMDRKYCVVIASRPTLDEVATAAAQQMAHWNCRRTGMSVAEIAMLLSAKGDPRICQAVDPVKTVRMESPRVWLEGLGVGLRGLL